MGRGQSKSNTAVKAESRSKPLIVQVGDIWAAPGERDLTIVGADQHWAHRGLIAKDELSIVCIEPVILKEKYKLKKKAPTGKEINTAKPILPNKPVDPVKKQPVKPMSKAQEGYLKRLCTDHGEEFDPSLDRVSASKMIGRLEALSKSSV